MPRYHFNFKEAQRYSVDEEGIEFDSLEHAYLNAVSAAREIWHERLKTRQDPRHCAFEITDAAGRVLLELPFLEVLEACRRDSRPVATRTRFIDAAANARRMRQLVRELAEQIRTNEQAIRRARELVDRSKRLAPINSE